jgi:toxin ParE1/3/4
VSAGARRWAVRLNASAEEDFRQIVQWTAGQFGSAQARDYANTLSATPEALAAGPAVPGARKRPDIAAGLWAIHVTRRGRKGRHFVLFRAGRPTGSQMIDVLRILHDAMDLPRHLPSDDEAL